MDYITAGHQMSGVSRVLNYTNSLLEFVNLENGVKSCKHWQVRSRLQAIAKASGPLHGARCPIPATYTHRESSRLLSLHDVSDHLLARLPGWND